MTGAYVQSLPEFLKRQDIGRIRLRLRGMLRSAGGFGQAQPPASGSHAGSDSPLRFSTWPGKHLGVRCPYPAETPLSWEEVQHGAAEGVL